MNLLKAVLYDPAVAVSKATSALLAMTVFDTTNLRVALTIPAHGMIRVRLLCTITGATTLPTILLGVMNGATVLGRAAPVLYPGTANAATQSVTADAELTITGLTPGALSGGLDAAYAVQVVVAATNIKYGGPNTNAGANAWGAFVFEIWDPQPIPVVAAGASGGLLISGSNAGTTTLGALTVTAATTLTGNVALADGLTIAAPSTGNRAGLDIAGNGTGAALKLVAGGTGVGLSVAGGGTSGDGIKVTTTSGHGMNLAPVGTSMHGLLATGGNGGTSDGIKAAAGTGGVDLRAAITGNVTGNLSGSVASVTARVTANTDQLAGQTVTAAAGVTFPTSVASPTNITAGTITTTTNLTNAPTAGDFTATMKTSIGTAVTASAVASVTGNVGGNVTGSVGSVTGLTASDVGAIKTQTDKLTFTVANKLDVNILYVNGVQILGNGAGTPWGPA